MKTIPIFYKIFMPSAHAAEAMAEALVLNNFLVGYKEDYLIGFVEAEYENVVEEVRKHYPTLQMIRYERGPVIDTPDKTKEVLLTLCWNCGAQEMIRDGLGCQCPTCGARE